MTRAPGGGAVPACAEGRGDPVDGRRPLRSQPRTCIVRRRRGREHARRAAHQSAPRPRFKIPSVPVPGPGPDCPRPRRSPSPSPAPSVPVPVPVSPRPRFPSPSPVPARVPVPRPLTGWVPAQSLPPKPTPLPTCPTAMNHVRPPRRAARPPPPLRLRPSLRPGPSRRPPKTTTLSAPADATSYHYVFPDDPLDAGTSARTTCTSACSATRCDRRSSS